MLLFLCCYFIARKMTFLGIVPDIYVRKQSAFVACCSRIVLCAINFLDIHEESVCSSTTVKKESVTYEEHSPSFQT